MTDVRDDERNYDKVSVEVTFFKPSGKYYTDETIELPEELHGSISVSQPSEQDAATHLMYKRREWVSEAVSGMYVGMHMVCLASDVLGFPMMRVRNNINRIVLLDIAEKLESRGSVISFEREIAQSIRDAVDSCVEPQDVDVASLRELAKLMENGVNRTIFKADKNTIEHHFAYLLSNYASIIHKAIEGVPEPNAERESAADWVEANGGLSIVENRYVENALVKHDVCRVLGLDDVDGSVGYQLILAELDKRLMPQGMEWPRFEDGERVGIGDWFSWAGSTYTCNAVKFGDWFSLHSNDVVPSWYGYSFTDRVNRPESEVLGADGLTIKVDDTVWFANSANATEFVVAEMSTDSEYSVRMRLPESPEQDGQWFLPQVLTHTPPDTQERINDDASMDPSTYCDEVLGWGAEKIVHRSDYAAQNEAMIADLLRRQRELDAMTMGGAR